MGMKVIHDILFGKLVVVNVQMRDLGPEPGLFLDFIWDKINK